MERTLSIVKPDGVQKNLIGEVMRRFESNGLKVVGLKMVSMGLLVKAGQPLIWRGPMLNSAIRQFLGEVALTAPCAAGYKDSL